MFSLLLFCAVRFHRGRKGTEKGQGLIGRESGEMSEQGRDGMVW